jgi:hypothetical protein
MDLLRECCNQNKQEGALSMEIVANPLSEDEQTAQQKALFAYHEERARAARAAATADVLQFLDR